MKNLILDFAKSDDHIRAVVMNGSRVNPNAKRDIFQDFDIICFVTDVDPYRNNQEIIDYFGEILTMQLPEENVYPEADGDGHYCYLMQFADGNRLDLSFSPLDKIPECLKDSLTKVLLDKDNNLPELPPPSEESYIRECPINRVYSDVCNEFLFGLGSHIPKTLWREELPLLMFYMDIVLRKPLKLMLEWYIGIQTNYTKSMGKEGKYLQTYLEPEVWEEFRKTYGEYDSKYKNIWNALTIMHTLFRKVGKKVAVHYDFNFPEEEYKRVVDYLNHVRGLSKSAKTIY